MEAQKTPEVMRSSGLENLGSVSGVRPNIASGSSSSPQKSGKPKRVFLKIAVVVAVLFVCSGVSFAAIRVSKSGKTSNQNALDKYPTVNGSTVLGQDTATPTQSFGDLDKVVVNGNLVLNGGVALSPAAVGAIAAS